MQFPKPITFSIFVGLFLEKRQIIEKQKFVQIWHSNRIGNYVRTSQYYYQAKCFMITEIWKMNWTKLPRYRHTNYMFREVNGFLRTDLEPMIAKMIRCLKLDVLYMILMYRLPTFKRDVEKYVIIDSVTCIIIAK